MYVRARMGLLFIRPSRRLVCSSDFKGGSKVRCPSCHLKSLLRLSSSLWCPTPAFPAERFRKWA